jgi:hypothetical protein
MIYASVINYYRYACVFWYTYNILNNCQKFIAIDEFLNKVLRRVSREAVRLLQMAVNGPGATILDHPCPTS